MDLNSEPEENSIKDDIPEESLEKNHKKTTLKQTEKNHQIIADKPSHDDKTDNFIEGLLENVSPTYEKDLNKDLENPKPLKEKKKNTKLQNPDEKNLEFEKGNEDDKMILKSYKNKEKNYEKGNIEVESDSEDKKERKSDKGKKSDQGYENEDINYDRNDIDDVLVKKPTLKKKKSEEDFNDTPMHPPSFKKQDTDDYIQDPPKDPLHKKLTIKTSQPAEEFKSESTENKKLKKPKKVIPEKPPSREPIDPNPIYEKPFQEFKEIFSAEDDRQLIEKKTSQDYENPKNIENLEENIYISKKTLPKQTKEKKQKSSEKSQSSRSSSNSNRGKHLKKNEKTKHEENNTKMIKQLLANEMMNNEPEDKNPECPDTPNLGSPIKEVKSLINNQGSAYWSRNEHELENEKLKAKLQEYEETIKRQNDEIKYLKKQLIQHTEKTKRISSPKNPGYFNKKSDGNFFKKEPDLRKEDMDFWNIPDEGLYQKEPQKLEEISALKDLWILNIESGSALYNNISIKKTQGVKPNPLTRAESSKSGNTKSRVLPKISMKREYRKN
ncbi:hypothetical protein SteCoe_5032 [Stentor coeruleus]|uniref:Uncharacterized protein n=1 Tax=Stentor coeruleus TaxID=5963 RepID=A0A1R2CTE3_9CILI|nr:hypothetical protein SteCoe_5032 [Stentor coeruleus]